MSIAKSKQGDVTVVVLQGWSLEVDMRKLLTDELLQLVDDGETKILVDFSAVDYITSGGLSALLTGARRIAEVNGSFALCSLGDNVKRVFEISSFTALFDIYPDADAGLAALK